MAVETKCQTPGAQFHTHIRDKDVYVLVELPEPLNLSEAEARLLEANLHNAVELVLARYFNRRKRR